MSNAPVPDQKILTLDIEWRPTTAFVWGAYDQNIAPNQIVEHGGLLCVGAKWLGENKTYVFSEWSHGHHGMLEAIHDMWSEADAIITYNGDRYDLPKLMGEFVLHGLTPPPPVTSIDCLKAVKKFGFMMNKLAFIAPLLGVGSKMENEGMGMWVKAMAGDSKAQKKMDRYCAKDVKVTESLYLRIRPFIRTHPHLGRTGASQCPACGSARTHSRGTRRTRSFKIQRLQCQDCGHWGDGKRVKI